MSNIKPGGTTVTVVDPETHKKLDQLKKDTETILSRLDKPADKPAQEPPRYFPRGYFP